MWYPLVETLPQSIRSFGSHVVSTDSTYAMAAWRSVGTAAGGAGGEGWSPALFSMAKIGLLAWIPFLWADVGNLVGGGASSLLIRRGWSVDRARKAVLLTSAALIPLGVAVIVSGASDAVVIAAISLIAFAFQSWIVNIHTIPSDTFPKQDVGSVFGIGGMAAGIASMVFTLLIGWIVDRFSYTPVYVMVGMMAPFAAILFLLVMRRIERVPEYAG